jgi:hypothetical protein
MNDGVFLHRIKDRPLIKLRALSPGDRQVSFGFFGIPAPACAVRTPSSLNPDWIDSRSVCDVALGMKRISLVISSVLTFADIVLASDW